MFDEIKNKLGEKKAWATSLEAKETQALRIAITHNLPVRYEAQLERQQGVINAAEAESVRASNRTHTGSTP